MEQTEFVMPTPGSLFREKRRKLGWSIKDVSEELLLSVSQVEAIEQDDFDSLPETPYIVGYWRNYGNLLGIDITEEINLQKKNPQTPLSDIVLNPNHRSAHHLQEKLRKKSAVVFLVLSVLFLGAVWYWQTPENILITQWSDMNPDHQLVILDPKDKPEQGVVEDNIQLDIQDISVIVLPEPNFSEGSGIGDAQQSDRLELGLPENPVPQAEQSSPDGSEQVLENVVENTDNGFVNQEVTPSNSNVAEQSSDPALLPSGQDESRDPTANVEIITSGAEEAETIAPEAETIAPEAETVGPEAETVGPEAETVATEAENTITELAAVPSEAVEEEAVQVEKTDETVETGEQEASREDGNGSGEVVVALSEVAGESIPSVETVETEQEEASLDSSIDTVIDPTSKDQIVVHVEKPMWMDVRERDGTKLLFRNVLPDEFLIINGKAPFWVYLGEAGSASVVYLGQPIEFEANEGESFVQLMVGEFPGPNTVEPVVESNE